MRIPFDRFEQVIDEKILERGLRYFKNGAVGDPEELEPGLYEVLVSGTENYTVRLRVKNEAITENVCDCPYDLGPVCKHVAAVIFHLRQTELAGVVRERKETTPRPARKMASSRSGGKKTVADQVQALLEKLDREAVDRFILERATEDRAFRSTFLAEFAHLGEGRSKATYAAQLKALLRGRDHWGLARPLSATAAKLLERAKRYIADAEYATALIIATAVAEELVKALDSVDDSSGHVGSTINEAVDLLNTIAGAGDAAMREEVVAYCIMAAEKELYEGWDWHQACIGIAVDHVVRKADTARLRKLIEADGRTPYHDAIAGRLMLVLLRRTEGEAAADRYLRAHLHIAEFRAHCIAQAIAVKHYDEATRLAEEAITHDVEEDKARPYGATPHFVSQWTHQLLDIALAQQDAAKAVEHARAMFIHIHNCDREKMYGVMRAYIPPTRRPHFIEQLVKDIKARSRFPSFDHIAFVLVKEERWHELLSELKGQPRPGTIEQYEAYLAEGHAAELADLYANAIRHELKAGFTGRKDYQRAARHIRRMVKLGQRAKADALTAELRSTYPKRSALLEELERV